MKCRIFFKDSQSIIPLADFNRKKIENKTRVTEIRFSLVFEVPLQHNKELKTQKLKSNLLFFTIMWVLWAIPHCFRCTLGRVVLICKIYCNSAREVDWKYSFTSIWASPRRCLGCRKAYWLCSKINIPGVKFLRGRKLKWLGVTPGSLLRHRSW